MAWSIFTQGGGDGAAVTWAKMLLSKLGAPDTPATEQFIYDWEKSEGGGGKFNPLNQGPVPGHKELTSTGPQFGGGAADFVSWDAGLQGAVDYINMPNYTAVKSALMAGNASGARQALISSPWAESHYNNGAGFSNASLPGQASALPGYVPGQGGVGGPVASLLGGSASSIASAFNPFQWLLDKLGITSIRDLLERGALIAFGSLLMLIAVLKFTDVGNKFKATFVTAAGLANPVSRAGTAAGAAVKIGMSSKSPVGSAGKKGAGNAADKKGKEDSS